jgi:hypothetical protein
LVTGLFDDAAVFPPGNADVPAALAEHRRHRDSWYSDLIGPLLLRASTVEEALTAGDAQAGLTVALVADRGLVELAEARNRLLDREERLVLSGIEVALPPGEDPEQATRVLLEQLSFSVPAAIEVPRTGFVPALDVLAEDGAERAKFRTGGETPAAHPSEAELAAFLHAAVQRRLPFKLTAGLHHPIRIRTESGLEQHGFLNVLAAVAAALQGAGAADLADVLARRELDDVVPLLSAAPPNQVRALFTSFGCCGVTDPIDHLVTAGLLTPEG